MAAEAINPRVASPHAYRNGADLIIAGKFDFRVEANTKIAIEALYQLSTFTRPLRGYYPGIRRRHATVSPIEPAIGGAPQDSGASSISCPPETVRNLLRCPPKP
jgi:hypothetical protein